jgi:hypothetical protein
MTMPTTAVRRSTHAPRYARRRPWWLGALDRELLALGRYLSHRLQVTVAATAIFAVIYLGANGGTLG